MKYTFTLLRHDHTAREKIVLESRASESPRHIVLKVLGYLLFRDSTNTLPLRIEPTDLGQRHRPDLLASEPITDKPLLWIDCGQIETKRLARIAAANHGARIIVIKQSEREAKLYAEAARRDLPVLGAGTAQFVGYLGFDEGFAMRVVALLRGANTLCLIPNTDDRLGMTWNDEPIETQLHTYDHRANSVTPADFRTASSLKSVASSP